MRPYGSAFPSCLRSSRLKSVTRAKWAASVLNLRNETDVREAFDRIRRDRSQIECPARVSRAS